MNKKTYPLVVLFLVGVLALFYNFKEDNTNELRKKHAEFLKNSPVKETLKLSKKERKGKGLPPNKYFEREWELTMNPATGKPTPEKVLELQKELNENRFQGKVSGDAVDNAWLERGPNNVGGRTRTLLFDPNDATNKRVFAGGVSGGLWVNNDITATDSKWIRITDVPSNMAVSSITVDPNNSNIFYLGTGELYTSGSVTGNGIYKSVNGGTTWTHVFGGNSGTTITGGQYMVPGQYFVQDIIAWNNNGVTEVFAAVGASWWRYGASVTTFLGGSSDYGVYKTTDGGTTWTKPTVPKIDNHIQQPNDFEIGADNKLWLSTTRNYYGDNGGAILSTTDGNTFTEVTTLSNLRRTEIEVSATDPNKLYVLAQTSESLPVIYKTTDAFATAPTEMSLPDDADNGIPANDFTRGQSFYDLMIEADPTNDDILYVGGIDLFRSEDGASTWVQISKWSNNNALNSLSVPTVHADQHAMAFRPGNSNEAVFGNDGGVFYATSLSSASSSTAAIKAVNKDYNVTQFYRGAIAPTVANEYFLGGTQDNGTPYFDNPITTGPDSSVDISGGDGAYCFVDQVGESYLITSYVYNNSYRLYDFTAGGWRTINSDQNGDGDFINPANLDSNLDILYANGSKSSSYKIYRYSNLTAIPASGTATKFPMYNSLLNASPTAFVVSPYTTTSSLLLVGTESGKLLKVENANTNSPTWSEITGANFLGSISDIEFGANENEIFVTFHNYGVKNIWYTADGGTTWNSKEGDLPDIPVKTILQNPINPNEVIVGTDLGVWKTENWNDSNPAWTQSYNGMSDVKVTDLEYRSEDQTILAVTYGRGLFSGKFSSDVPTFILSNSNPNQSIYSGNEAVYTVNYQALTGFNESVDFTLTGNPEGTTVTFDPASTITLNTNGTLTVTIGNTTNNAIGGMHEMTLTGTSASKTKTLNFTLEIITDNDGDGILNEDDNCPNVANPDQKDNDEDGEGDACDEDDDNDGVLDENDNSPKDYNPDQTDTDGDGEGDVSDPDDDNDGVLDGQDNCPLTPNADQYDFDADGTGDACDTSIDIDFNAPKGFSPNGDGINDTWVIEKIKEIYPENHVKVFNRSGKLVFEAKGYDNTWDGVSTQGGSGKLPVGSYFYTIESGNPVESYYPEGYVKQGWIYINY